MENLSCVTRRGQWFVSRCGLTEEVPGYGATRRAVRGSSRVRPVRRRSAAPQTGDGVGARIAAALGAACGPFPTPSFAWPGPGTRGAVVVMVGDAGMRLSAAIGPIAATAEATLAIDVDALVARLFEQEGHRLVRLAR